MAYSFLEKEIKRTFQGLPETLPCGSRVFSGKVRDIIDLGDTLVISTSDRISAFDRVLSTIPCKGEVLNKVALHWFSRTEDILPNHIIESVTPRTVAVRKCEMLPVEVVVRGYLTGSAWRDYKAGKPVSGIALPSGMQMNQRFETPLITPSTKAEQGLHDEPISSEEILRQGLVDPAVWDTVQKAAIALFRRGTDDCARQGLILVDTKYEFGILNGQVYLVDEVHTPDSSRFWFADSYDQQFRAGKDPHKLDKEYLRQWLMDKGFMGDGEAPEIPDEVRIETARRYVGAYEGITGTTFTPEAGGLDEVAAVDEYVKKMR
ncbi:phosphoribosylaminoimidazolesuccinocarboxamide synthase [Marispirochaeta aestuarii]|uniref:Phosphoribosylaminoimidazole-succinocarboxamide synthase n=1 Tax=Marispirochaeta aestuarii TaxID=1963862 RepID=A0A1Y1RZ79_9SPIO|nr:phosphoribosylaminoimidazolesuccinocarboxamide synthase [Marispirochaeta aestuarii]ORC35345.1 phosphoribosylaminoimidazolesuccinocarboxamide synthase [Marispirochaeta aestuarii]